MTERSESERAELVALAIELERASLVGRKDELTDLCLLRSASALRRLAAPDHGGADAGVVPKRLLNERDNFIVSKGLWSDFVDHLKATDAAVDANASAEARDWGITDDMVEDACKAYADATGYYVQFHRGLSSESSDKMRKGMSAALKTLSAHPHASETKDVDWDDVHGMAPNATGNLSSEDFVRNLRDEWRDPHASDCDKQGDSSLNELLSNIDANYDKGEVHSDRTADVKCDALASFIAAKAQVDFGGWQTDLARALLDAFKVSRP